MTLPLATYFEPVQLERERLDLLETPFRYAGHEAWIPQPGDYACPPHDPSVVLVNHDGSPTLLDNVCAHRQAVLLEGTGRLGRQLLCPIHAWSYRLDGSLRHAPGMDPAQCAGLRRHPLHAWNGLLFNGGSRPLATLDDLDDWPLRGEVDFDGYRLQRIVTEGYAFDWKIFLEVYLDLYHVRPYHPGLGRLVACDELTWAFGRHWSCQVAPFGSPRGGTETFEAWCRLIRRRHPAQPPRFGALWLTIYPNTTVEWYPDVLVVSTIWPNGPDRCTNVVEFYYPESLGPDLEAYAAAHQAAYDETAVEDGDICLRMHRGKRALWRQGRDAASPDHDPLELGIGHFHDWLSRHLLASQPTAAAVAAGSAPPSRVREVG